MLIKSALATQMSGSIGGMTGSHNSGGMYLRARAIPVNKNTAFQNQVRSAFTSLVNSWTEILSDTQREAWRNYAANVPVTNALGDAREITGQNWFIASNTPVLQSAIKGTGSVAPSLDAPTIFDRGDFSDPTSFTLTGGSDLEFAFNDSDAWANEDNGALFIFQGRPRNATRMFFAGPWRLIGAVLGDGDTPPSTPHTITGQQLVDRGWPLVEGQKVSIAFAARRADGRLSTRRIFTEMVAAP